MLFPSSYMFYSNRVEDDVTLNIHVPRPATIQAIIGHLNRSLFIIMHLDVFIDRGCHELFHLSLKNVSPRRTPHISIRIMLLLPSALEKTSWWLPLPSLLPRPRRSNACRERCRSPHHKYCSSFLAAFQCAGPGFSLNLVR